MNSTHLESELSFNCKRKEMRRGRSEIDLQAFSLAVQAAKNTDQLKSIMMRTLRAARVDFLELSNYRRLQLSSVVWSELANLGDSDCQHFMQPFSDAYACRAIKSGQPEPWAIARGGDTSPCNIGWLSTLRAHAIGAGVTIAIHGANDRRTVFHFGAEHRLSFDADGTSIANTIAFIVSQRLAFWDYQAAGPAAIETALSVRELEVLRWSKDGKSYLEIARILGISNKTVEFHIANAMRKLGVNQKISAIVAAAREGLIDL